MKRDMDVIRKILLAIEDQFVDVAIYNLKVDGLDMKTIAYHCKILHDGGLLTDYGAQFADDELYTFGVGSLSWEGHEFLDKIRDEGIWSKTKDVATKKGLPLILDVVKNVATAIITQMTTAAVKGIVEGITQ